MECLAMSLEFKIGSGEKIIPQSDQKSTNNEYERERSDSEDTILSEEVEYDFDDEDDSEIGEVEEEEGRGLEGLQLDNIEHIIPEDGIKTLHSVASNRTAASDEEDGGVDGSAVGFLKSQAENSNNDSHSKFGADSTMVSNLNQGIRIFNLNPHKGIEFVQRKGIVNKVPGDDVGNARRVAIFLRYTRGLNKEQIGKILGGEKRQHIRILENYFVLFDFSQEGPTIAALENCLRGVFACFKPMGEAQKIQRIVEVFAEKFNEDTKMARDKNPELAEFHPSTTMLLAYSIILLNVDLHNPNNPRRMTKAQYINNCRGVDEGGDLPRQELENLYDRIARNEIRHKIDRDDVAGNLFTNPDKSGWLYKKGVSRFSKWRPRWFILSENTLYYFKNSEDVEPLGFIPLENVLIRTCLDPKATNKNRSFPNSFNSSDLDDESSIGHHEGSGKLSANLLRKLPHARSDFFKHASSNDLAAVNSGGSANTITGFTAMESSSTISERELRIRTSKRQWWFELYPMDERLNVKSARVSKKGVLVLGQHRTVKLRTDSRQEMEQWVELLNQKGRFSQSLQEMTMRARFQPRGSDPGTPISGSLASSSIRSSKRSSFSSLGHGGTSFFRSVFKSSSSLSSKKGGGSATPNTSSDSYSDYSLSLDDATPTINSSTTTILAPESPQASKLVSKDGFV